MLNEHTTADGNSVPHKPTLRFPIVRLIIIDRRALIRECISSYLRLLSRNIEILRGVRGAAELRSDEIAQADIVMLCGNPSPAVNKMVVQDEITSLLRTRPDLSIVLIADSRDSEEAKYLVAQWRLRGYIPTSSTLAGVEAALDAVLAGGTYLPPKSNDETGAAPGATDAPDRIGTAKLTERERAVLFFLRDGMPNKVIAHRLGISQFTVKAHIHSILTKLRSRNRTEAAVLAESAS